MNSQETNELELSELIRNVAIDCGNWRKPDEQVFHDAGRKLLEWGLSVDESFEVLEPLYGAFG
ncbi:hypothetical protein LCGC14_2075580 [marine sediment metagenome]|uniref:Uncharacterized protein n=1 Tax=marine sediment metagenome TaxID=412755 RepID=A0A0F9HE74_9ZZZZ